MTSPATTRSWEGVDSAIGQAVRRFSAQCLETYAVDERRVTEDASIEKIATEGGYARRQLYELIGNGADELVDRRGRIEVVLTDTALYCANEGRPVTEQGVGAILGSHNSTKDGAEIGRFGLGFKSVLGVSRTPAVYSRSGSFGFDSERALDAVRRVVPDAPKAAVLRLAEPIDPAAAAAGDEVLAELMDWADTIVIMPLDTGPTEWLPETFRSFPREFLLFSSHVEQLVLDDRTGRGHRRVIELEDGAGDLWELHERGTDGGSVVWKLFDTRHELSDAVRRDGGTMAERPVIAVHWAVPVSRPMPGSLWNFFPTTVETTLSGIVNAPFKLDESRTTLVPGEFNAELLSAAVNLVVDNLEQVTRPDDPGYVLELLPGRGKELKGWADEILSREVYQEAATRPSLPDQLGTLQRPVDLRMTPDGVGLDAADVWAAQPTRPTAWVHPSAIRNVTRRSRAARLMEQSPRPIETAKDWLEALCSRGSGEGSAAALRVAAELVATDLESEMRRSRIVLTEQVKLVAPTRGTVFRPAASDVDVDVALVASEVLREPGVEEALDRLRIPEVSPLTVLDALADRALAGPERSETTWREIWALADRVTDAELSTVLIEKHQMDASDVVVLTMAGRSASLSNILLPGDLLAPEDFRSSHRGLLVDIERHRRHLGVLRRLGAADRPVRAAGSIDEPWLAEYRRDLIRAAIDEARQHGARVKSEHYELVPAGPWPGPATPLDGLLEEAAVRYARELLAVCDDLDPWTLRRNKGRVIDIEVEHPILRRVRELGHLPTDMGVQPIGVCVTPHLKEMGGLLPVADIPRFACRALSLPDTVEELDERRTRTAMLAVEALEKDDAIGGAYAALSAFVEGPPDRIRAIVRRDPVWAAPGDTCVTANLADLKVLRGTGVAFVRVPTDHEAERLISQWGLRRITDVVGSRILAQEDGDRQGAVDAFPLLRIIIGPAVERVELRPCSELSRELFTEHGSISEPLEFELRDDVFHHLSGLTEQEIVLRLAERLGKQLSPADARAVIENAQAAEVQAHLQHVRSAETDVDRLLRLFGADELRSRIPDLVLEAVEETDGELGGDDIAELALTVFGIEILKVFSDALVKIGLAPPSEWAGRRTTVRFVTEDLGFPRKYAGFAGIKVPDTLVVPGPSALPDLHPFQKRAAAAIRDLIRQPTDRRGLLSLPTGAGKTRVAVEALVQGIAAGELESPLLWIAQTMELCEQAVQSWAEVWQAVGPQRSLKISRLWSGYSAEAKEEGGDQVVVATIQKLTGCMPDSSYDWLRAAACVVVDEAHTSTTPTYTDLLRWTGIDRDDDHAPLIGLSATPYRGRNAEETKRLAERYSKLRLDEGIFEDEVSIPLLQEQGILAKVDHRVLMGSEQVPMTTAERDHIQRMKSIPNSVSSKIGRDLDRTHRLVESVMTLDEEWPVLMFAASVAHAETLAALISRRGRSAAAVSGDTPEPVRRHLISEFRDGRLRTLTNYGVLTQGFDAPSIRALYIARPTYSPNLYLQMIGRGLRGPANRGKEVCLVVDVQDNVAAYGLDLAYNEFEYVWKR